MGVWVGVEVAVGLLSGVAVSVGGKKAVAVLVISGTIVAVSICAVAAADWAASVLVAGPAWGPTGWLGPDDIQAGIIDDSRIANNIR